MENPPAAKILEKKGILFDTIQLEKPAFTVSDVVKYSSGRINAGQIIKTMVLKDKNREFFAVCLCGEDRVDFAKLEKIRGKTARLASPEEVFRIVGIKIGAINPVGLNIPLYIDFRVMNLEKVNFASGKHDMELEAGLESLLKAVDFEEADVAE